MDSAENGLFYHDDCKILRKTGDRQYGTSYINVGIPIPVYRTIAAQCEEMGHTLDKSEEVTRDAQHYTMNINIRGQDTGDGVMLSYHNNTNA